MTENEKKAAAYLRSYDGPAVRIMEVCGTHTHEIFKLGIRKLLSANISLISGPGCPVCVTSAGFIDEAILLAEEKQATITTFGDLVRVPGSAGSLQDARGRGAKVEVVYSPLDAVSYAKAHPGEETVFLSVGFETTTPSECLAVEKAIEEHVSNFSLLTANKTMPGAYEAMAESTDVFLYPGHVHAIIGTKLLFDLAKRGVSGVCAGFTASELLTALAVAVKKHAEGKPFFVNCYPRVVTEEGSAKAKKLVDTYMEPCDAYWRGIGTISSSGMQLRKEYAAYDARAKFSITEQEGKVNAACRCGEILRGQCIPPQCPLFGKTCRPEHPVGACMVSGEGACSAYYLYENKGER